MKLGSSIPNYIVKSKNICFLNNGRDVCFDKKKKKKSVCLRKKIEAWKAHAWVGRNCLKVNNFNKNVE